VDFEFLEARTLLLILFLFSAGICSILHAAIERRRQVWDDFLSASPLTLPAREPPAGSRAMPFRIAARKTLLHRELRSPWDAWSSFGLPKVGLTLAIIFILTCASIGVLQSWSNENSRGLRVLLSKPGVEGPRSPGKQPMLVHIKFTGWKGPPSLYVDSRLVPKEALDSMLQKELLLRPPHWPVYLDGDPDVEWKDAVWVIDRIRGHGAEVMLLPRPKAKPRAARR
jgi:biopolymer transport protein ExbD